MRTFLHLGQAIDLWNFLWLTCLFQDDPERPGWKLHDAPVKMCMLANTRYAAAQVMFAPHAQISEGCVDFVLISKMSRFEQVQKGWAWRRGLRLEA